MNADTNTTKQIFQIDRCFIIPVYQRPYVWKRELQWEPLWNDVQSTAERLAKVRQESHKAGIGASQADNAAAPHFLGAIVLEQLFTATGRTDKRLVVDGQQRLITLQLLLLGTLDALRDTGVEGPLAAKLRKLTRNDEEIVSGDDLHKVWPSRADRDNYRAAVAEQAPSEYESRFAAARAFFSESAKAFINEDDSGLTDPYSAGDPDHDRADLLVSTLLGLVKLVVIDLESVDDAQVIFEALNARNTPLSATDLVKNLLFMRARDQNKDPEELYVEVWKRFDDDDNWWRELDGIGHARRARQDWLVGDWLIAQRGEVVSVGRLYGEFRDWLDKSGISALGALRTLNRYADAYECLHARRCGLTPRELRSFGTISRLNITVATPVLLWLLTQPEHRLSGHDREMAFRAIESYVVRRMAAKYQTRGYARAFAEVLKAAMKADTNPGQAVVEAFRRGPSGYSWPPDEELAYQFRTARYYGQGGINRDRLRLILGAVDTRLQQKENKTEPVVIKYEKLQIDHVIPQEWKTYWPVQASDANEQMVLEHERETHIHRIGNLTLVSRKLNPSMGNDPWEKKRAQLQEHSKLRLNALLCQEDEWDESAIRKRGEWLAGEIASVWPGPDSSIWEY